MAKIDEANLYFRSGSSDKVYNAWIEEINGRCTVSFSYGRRGSSLIFGQKATNLSRASATSEFSKLVRSKTDKGYKYTVGSDQIRQSASARAAVSTEPVGKSFDSAPQLLNSIEEKDLNTYLQSDEWWMMEKVDGKRFKIRRDKAKNAGGNKKNIVVPIPEEVSADIDKLGYSDLLVDGELVGGKYKMFDLQTIEGQDLTDRPFYYRYSDLETFKQVIKDKKLDNLEVLPVYATTKQKREALAEIKAQRGEGVVFVRKDSTYTAGRPNSGGTRIKYKFTASATCTVAALTPGKRSVLLNLRDGSNLVTVGNVTILPNFPIPKIGALVEVKYLCAYRNGSLREPVYLGERDDQSTCDDIASLKFKQDAADEEEE